MDDLDVRFDHHAPSAGRGMRHIDARAAVKSLARVLDDSLPDGREKSLAMTKLEEVMFWASASIAREGR